MNPRISFVIPVYNVAEYIAECLESIIRIEVDKEIIIVDDGSTDNSLQIAQAYFKKYHYIKIYQQHNAGVSVARNKGLALCSGKYVYFVDPDDFLIETEFEALLNLADEKQVDVMKGLMVRSYDDGRPMELVPPLVPGLALNDWQVVKGYDHLGQMLERDFLPSACYGFFRVEYLKAQNISFPLGLLLAEDGIFCVDVYTKDLNMKLIEIARPFYHYRKRGGSATHQYNIKYFQTLFDACNLVWQKIDLLDKDIEHRNEEEKAILKGIRFNLLRVIAIWYGMAYRFQYLNYDDKLRKEVEHYFKPGILKFMRMFLPFEIKL